MRVSTILKFMTSSASHSINQSRSTDRTSNANRL
nr:MAG TPA: hypothetical protein [Caudoviricetes sp.]